MAIRFKRFITQQDLEDAIWSEGLKEICIETVVAFYIIYIFKL